MMFDVNLLIALAVLQIIIQSAAVFFFYRYWKQNHRAWAIYVMYALCFMVLRRVTAILSLSGVGSVDLIDKVVLPLVISLLFLRGSHALLKDVV